uniref:Uncharacterized protein n=1 Tax=Quercus lobata TaxID=97700 RepID=A0A7N2LGZ2_QUELO
MAAVAVVTAEAIDPPSALAALVDHLASPKTATDQPHHASMHNRISTLVDLSKESLELENTKDDTLMLPPSNVFTSATSVTFQQPQPGCSTIQPPYSPQPIPILQIALHPNTPIHWHAHIIPTPMDIPSPYLQEWGMMNQMKVPPSPPPSPLASPNRPCRSRLHKKSWPLEAKPDILVILEPKISGSHAEHVIDQVGLPCHFRVDPVSLSGGIWVLWDDHRCNVDVVHANDQSVAILIRCLFQYGLNGEEVPPPNISYSSSKFSLQDFHDTLSLFLNDSEILSTLRSMHPLKPPGPDGFHAQSFQNNW